MKVLIPFGKKTASTQPIRLSMRVVEEAHTDIGKLLARLNTRRKGLTDAEVKERLRQYGFNEVLPFCSMPIFRSLPTELA